VTPQKIGFWQLLALAVLMNILSQLAHESGHWAVYQAYGRGPVWGFIGIVQIWDQPPLHPQGWVPITSQDGAQGWLRLASPAQGKWEQALNAAAGPLTSLLAASLGLWMFNTRPQALTRLMGLGLCLTSSLVMTLYYLRSPMRVGGDEYDVAVQLGIPRLAVEIPFALAFLVVLALGLRAIPTWRSRLKWLGIILLGGIPTGIFLNFADAAVRAQINLGNPLFQPVLGFSLPVFVTGVLALLGLWAWRQLISAKE
jgi:hypothetical protein